MHRQDIYRDGALQKCLFSNIQRWRALQLAQENYKAFFTVVRKASFHVPSVLLLYRIFAPADVVRSVACLCKMAPMTKFN